MTSASHSVIGDNMNCRMEHDRMATSPRRTRHHAHFAMSVVVALMLSGCSVLPGNEPQDAAEALAQGLRARDVSGIGFSNATGSEVQADLDRIFRMTGGIAPDVRTARVSGQGQTAHGDLNWTWDLPATEEDWTYTTGVDFQRSNGTWKATWEPSLVAPELAEDEVLRIQTIQPERGKILGTGDQPLAMEQTIHRVGLDLREVPREKREGSATALAKAAGIDPEQYREKVRQADDNAWVEAIALREEDFRALDSQSMEKIPGLLVTKDARVLGRTKGFAAETLGTVGEATAEEIEKSGGELTRGAQVGRGGLQEAHEDTLHGNPGVVVDRVGINPDGSLEAGQTHQLMAHAPVPGEDLHTTLNADLQDAAQQALKGIKSPSSVVAMRPSDGAVLAVANGEGSKGYPTATLGQYAPGSTFKVATSLAMLREGDTPDTIVDCPHTYSAEGMNVANFSGYPQEFEGAVPLRQAIAHSCNTAFAAQHEKISQQALAEAGNSLGVGVEMDAGIPVFSGSIPTEEPAAEHVAAMFGQGRTLVSPFGMARFQASVQAGKLVEPSILAHEPASDPSSSNPLEKSEAADLQTLEREVVSTGHLKELGSLEPDSAIGKTGTAEYGNENPPRTHSWIIAGHGDLAVAVFVEDGDLGSITGTPIMLEVLQAAQDLQ